MSSIALVRLFLLCSIVELFFWPYVTTFSGMALELVRMEQINGTHIAFASGMRVKKYNRTLAVLDGEAQLLQDLDDSYQGRVTVAYSRLGNNQFNEYPMKISQQGICELLNSSYREYQYIWRDHTNLPVVDGQGLCPFPKAVYWARNFAPDASWIPPMVPEGYWRMTFDLLDQMGTIQARALGFFKIMKKLI